MGALIDLAKRAGNAAAIPSGTPANDASARNDTANSTTATQLAATERNVAVEAQRGSTGDVRSAHEMEVRRQRLLTMLANRKGAQYAVLTDAEADQTGVILALAIRNLGTCEMRIPRSKFEPFVLLDLIGQLGVRH